MADTKKPFDGDSRPPTVQGVIQNRFTRQTTPPPTERVNKNSFGRGLLVRTASGRKTRPENYPGRVPLSNKHGHIED